MHGIVIRATDTRRCRGQDRWQRQDSKHADNRPDARAEEQYNEDEETQRGKGPSSIAETDHQKRTAIGVTDQDTEGNSHGCCYAN
jgi:hypothetical protein